MQHAKTAVLITEVIKTNLELNPQEVIVKILDTIPDLPSDDLTAYLLDTGKELGIEGKDVNEIISVFQETLKSPVSDVHRNTVLQDIAQVICFVATVAAGFLPPKWNTIIMAVLSEYNKLKEGE